MHALPVMNSSGLIQYIGMTLQSHHVYGNPIVCVSKISRVSCETVTEYSQYEIMMTPKYIKFESKVHIPSELRYEQLSFDEEASIIRTGSSIYHNLKWKSECCSS